MKKTPQADLQSYEPKISQVVSPEEAVRKSIYGTPVVFPIKFLGDEKMKKYNDKGRLFF